MDEKILDKIRRKLEADKQFMEDCEAYDNMDLMKWDLPASLNMMEWVRKRVSTDAHDVLKTAVNLFDTQHPKWEILPRGPQDGDAAEELERWLEWVMFQANRLGDVEPSRQMLKNSAKYGRIATQIDFLPYWCKEGSDEYKEAENHPFCITVHPAANIHYERGKYALRWVSAVSNICAAEAIDHWEAYTGDQEYGDKIKSAIVKVEDLLDDDPEARVMYVDYTDKDKRWCFCYLTPSDQIDFDLEPKEGEDFIEFIDAENKLGFIPWAVSVVASEPLLYSMHKGNIWENQCLLDTIADSVVLRRGFFPLFKHTSVSGKQMETDFTGVEAVIEQNASDGEQTEVLTPPPLDPGIREMMDRNSNKGASATGLKGLQNMNLVGNVQFASINAMIQVSKSTLDPYLSAYQHNAVELAKLAFMWIQKSGKTITGYRTKDKSRDTYKVKGQKINVGPDKFDPKTMVIQCELLSTNPSDEMQRMNVYSQAVQIGLPLAKKQIVERMGWGEGDVLEADWLKEKIQEMALASFQQMQQMQLQQMAQAQQMQAQQAQAAQAQAAQQQQGGGGMSPPEQMGGSQMFDNASGGGFNPNQGGNSPMMAAPQMTRTATQGPQ